MHKRIVSASITIQPTDISAKSLFTVRSIVNFSMPCLIYVNRQTGKVIDHPAQLTMIELLSTQYHHKNSQGVPQPQAAIYLVTGPTPTSTHSELLNIAQKHFTETISCKDPVQIKYHVLRTQGLYEYDKHDVVLHYISPTQCFCGDPDHSRFLELITFKIDAPPSPVPVPPLNLSIREPLRAPLEPERLTSIPETSTPKSSPSPEPTQSLL